MSSKTRVEVPLGDGVALILDADILMGSGLSKESVVVHHCKEWEVQVVMKPVNSPVDEG